MPSKTVDIPGIGSVVMYKRRGNSNMRLSFKRDGSLRLSLPYWVPYQAGVEFVRSRRDWIRRHQPADKQTLRQYDRIGKAHRIVFEPSLEADKATVRNGRNQVVVTFPATMTMEQAAVQSAAERGAIRALKAEAEALLPQRLNTLALQHGFSYTSVSVKKLASRWGSCSQHKDITLNLFLMQLPWHLIDYVLIHELVHTEHLDHSQSFWRRFEKSLPGARDARKQLKQYQTVVTPAA